MGERWIQSHRTVRAAWVGFFPGGRDSDSRTIPDREVHSAFNISIRVTSVQAEVRAANREPFDQPQPNYKHVLSNCCHDTRRTGTLGPPYSCRPFANSTYTFCIQIHACGPRAAPPSPVPILDTGAARATRL